MHTYEYDALNKRRWTTPDSYAGYDPVGHVVIATRHRDSDALERSNFECIKKHLTEKAEPLQGEDDDPLIYDWRAGHWAVGWVEYLMMRPEAPDDLQRSVVEVLEALDAYPVFDEDHFSTLEWNEVQDCWSGLSVSERVEYIKDAGGNIFAARHDELTAAADPNGVIFDRLRAA